jgi:hypothetical protein
MALSVDQVSRTARHKRPKRERTRPMVALTRDFHVFASRVTTRLPAVFFSNWYIAKAWYVRAFFRLMISHYQFSHRETTATLDQLHADFQTPPCRWHNALQGFMESKVKKSSAVCQQADSCVSIWTVSRLHVTIVRHWFVRLSHW